MPEGSRGYCRETDGPLEEWPSEEPQRCDHCGEPLPDNPDLCYRVTTEFYTYRYCSESCALGLPQPVQVDVDQVEGEV
jgi:hypothetical protein